MEGAFNYFAYNCGDGDSSVAVSLVRVLPFLVDWCDDAIFEYVWEAVRVENVVDGFGKVVK